MLLTLSVHLPIADILQQLETYLVYQSMAMALSPAVRFDVESDLLADALKIFQLQATAIACHFGASRKHIIETHIQRSSFMQRPQVRMATMALDTAPVVEEGKQVITVSVSGVVELFDE